MYSQHNEEEIIKGYFPDLGTYLDVGAGDPKEFSNTFGLYELGWRGVLVEPFFKYTEDILKIRPEDKLCKKVITNHVGKVEMLNTASVETDIGKLYKEDIVGRTSHVVPCYTIKEFLEEYPEMLEPDFMNLDIETGEEALLSCCDFNIFKPKLLCIEFEVRGKNYKKDWEPYLEPFYTPVQTVTFNQFYLRKP